MSLKLQVLVPHRVRCSSGDMSGRHVNVLPAIAILEDRMNFAAVSAGSVVLGNHISLAGCKCTVCGVEEHDWNEMSRETITFEDSPVKLTERYDRGDESWYYANLREVKEETVRSQCKRCDRELSLSR